MSAGITSGYSTGRSRLRAGAHLAASLCAFCLLLPGGSRPALAQDKVDPFKVSNYTLPPDYTGPRFVLNHDYPQTAPPPPADPPWAKVSGGKPLNRDNAIAYAQALKDHIAPTIRTLILDYAKWDPAQAGWYSMPWLFDIQEPIHGAYVGSSFPASMFPLSGLKKPMTTYVVTLYDPTAAYTLGRIWGQDAQKPDLSANRPQYAEGAIIIKVALTTASPQDWPPMKDAFAWTLFAPPANATDDPDPKFFEAYVFQLDIIVKDSKAAPDTQWVFTTLVHDASVPGDAWDRLVPLGAMWGNDPLVSSANDPNAILQQNVINPLAPLYATETLGYGGRLSGPNDGAVVQDVVIDGKLTPRAAVSSCMSCHGVAESPMKSFLLPMHSFPIPGNRVAPYGMDLQSGNGPNYAYQPGGFAFNRWFQSRPGNVPQDAGQVPLDYHMNLTWKALPLWMKYNPAPTAIRPEVPARLDIRLLDPARTPKDGLIRVPLQSASEPIPK